MEAIQRHTQDIHEDEELTSTQNMIKDSRARRNNKGKQSKCENCDFKTGSMAILEQHIKKCQNEKSLDKSMEKAINSKRIHCKKCDSKFNKEKTYNSHMKNVHKETNIENSSSKHSVNYTKLTFQEKSRTLRSHKSKDSAQDLNSWKGFIQNRN